MKKFSIIALCIVCVCSFVCLAACVNNASSVTASAEEENVISSSDSVNSVPLAPGAVLIYEDYEEELSPLWSYSGVGEAVDLSFLDLTPGIYQIVCKGFWGSGESFLLTNLVYVDSEYFLQSISVSDYGAGDQYFDVSLCIETPYTQLYHDTFFNSFRENEGSYVIFYALYKIEGEPSLSGVNIDQISDIMFDGVSFSANAIASSISYTFENLFLNEDGTLTVYTQLVLWFAGISLLLSFVRLLTDWLFSLGGNKDKL